MTIRTLATSAIVLATGLLISAHTMAASGAPTLGVADGVWLKTKFATKGAVEIHTGDSTVTKKSSKGDCYTRLVYSSGDPGTYTGTVYCQTGASSTYIATSEAFSLSELPNGNTAYAIDDEVRFSNSSGHIISGYGNHILTIKRDKDGYFKSATLKTLAGELVNSTVSPGNGDVVLAGGYTSTSVSVSPEKIPPELAPCMICAATRD